MLFHDKGTVNIADVVRYIVTYDPSHDPVNGHKILSCITSASHAPGHSHPKLHLRIRNNASMLLRAAYLQGPYVLAVSVREDTFHANDETIEASESSIPIHEPDLKTSTSFWAELGCDQKYSPFSDVPNFRRTWIIEIASQAMFANAPTTYTITMGHTKESTRKAAHSNDLITSSPGLKIEKLTTAELWAPPPILPEHKNVHLVILTHGLHSNVTADMLYLKERIEQTAGLHHRPDGGVVIRGYSRNVCKTERGIKWLGKRMGKWLLQETLWLEQVGCFAPDAPPYSRISFIGHSLGGVVQNFAIAFVELATNGEFFRKLRPVHLITLASPWLGVSAENPAYVKLALDVGLIGRTGQDLGLMSRLGQRLDNFPDKKQIRDSRPILRLLALPNSPAHRVIRRFCTRTIYANVVNDGIVPLRTSAMFFLDWNSFDPVQKSVTQNGVIPPLGSLPGIVGLPAIDDLLGGVERMFGSRKEESDDTKSPNDRLSNELSPPEKPHSRSQLLLPSFLRRKSTHCVHNEKSTGHHRRKSMPSIRTNSFDLEKEVAEAMGEDLRGSRSPRVGASSDAEVKESRKDLSAWNKEHPGEEVGYHYTTQPPEGGPSPSKENIRSKMEKHHLGNTSSSSTPSNVSREHQFLLTRPICQPTGLNASSIVQGVSDEGPLELPPDRPPTTMFSNDIVERPIETRNTLENPFEERRSTQPEGRSATGPLKNEHSAQGDSTVNPIFSMFQHLRPSAGKQPPRRKLSKVYHRSQTVSKFPTDLRPPPPRTTFWESFPSLINPPLPDENFITRPFCRPKTIFHDRLYTPEDIPPVSPSNSESSNGSDEQTTKREKLRLEEKIARDWHCDMTWRKVLVKLEPDAHNNIIVRRMFPNAYGWPVVEHLVREHFKRDPDGLESEFTQESGVIPFDDDRGALSPSWKRPIMENESDDEMEESTMSSIPESMGRALLSDEESGEIMEMTEFPVRKDDKETEGGNNEIVQDVNKGAPLEKQFT